MCIFDNFNALISINSHLWGLSWPPFLTHSFSVQLKIEEVSRRLRTGDLGIPPNPEDRFDSLASLFAPYHLFIPDNYNLFHFRLAVLDFL